MAGVKENKVRESIGRRDPTRMPQMVGHSSAVQTNVTTISSQTVDTVRAHQRLVDWTVNSPIKPR